MKLYDHDTIGIHDSNPMKLPAQANIKISYRTHRTVRATRAIAIIDGIADATVALFGSSAGLVTPIKSRARLAKYWHE